MDMAGYVIRDQPLRFLDQGEGNVFPLRSRSIHCQNPSRKRVEGDLQDQKGIISYIPTTLHHITHANKSTYQRGLDLRKNQKNNYQTE